VPHPSVARRYARFVLGLALDQVPPPVAAKATLLALDTLGSCLASSREDFGRAVLEAAARLGGPQESTLVGTKARAGAASAVLANATLAHGLDFDDTREDAIVHTGCVAVTTALAVGEALGASGRAVIEAMIAGVEVMCRVGLAGPGRFHERHYHPTSLTGSFAAAAVAGKLYGLTEDQLVHAFGICGSQAGGIIEYLYPRQFIGHVAIRLHDGRLLEERQDHPRGGPDFPMTREEVEAKFLGNAALAVPAEQSARVVTLVGQLATQADLNELMNSLTA